MASSLLKLLKCGLDLPLSPTVTHKQLSTPVWSQSQIPPFHFLSVFVLYGLLLLSSCKT